MSDIVIFRQGETPQYLKSVNTPDYEGDPDVLINPDISAVETVPLKYWKRSGDTIVEMSANEKQVVEDAELQERKDAADTFNVTNELIVKGLIVAGNTRWSVGQTITKEDVVNWLKGQIT